MTKLFTELLVCEHMEVFKLYTKQRNVGTFATVQIYAHLKEIATSEITPA